MAEVPSSVPSSEQFRHARNTGNQQLLADAPVVASFFALDAAAYADGALPTATKELLGLVISVVKDCEECVYYHLERCHNEGVSRDQTREALQVALVGGGSVTLPLLRRATAFMAQLPSWSDNP